MAELDDLLTVSEAARLLDVSEPRVYALVDSGALPAFRRGNQYLIHAVDVEARRAQGVANGRPLDQTSAWAVLWLALARESGDLGPWGAYLSRNTRWRIRQKLADGPLSRALLALAPRLRHRGHLLRLRAHPSDVPRIAEEPDVVRTGVSAAADVGADIVAPGILEAYVPAARIDDLRAQYLLEESRSPNVLLRTVRDPWPFPPNTRVAPATAVALDLLDSSDERTQRAGRELLRALEQQARS
jgi:excisionase family DNA binding protein